MVEKHDLLHLGGIQARDIRNRILRQIFRPKRNENGEWRRLHNEELYNITRVNKSRR